MNRITYLLMVETQRMGNFVGDCCGWASGLQKANVVLIIPTTNRAAAATGPADVERYMRAMNRGIIWHKTNKGK